LQANFVDKKLPWNALNSYRFIDEREKCSLVFKGDAPLLQELNEDIKPEESQVKRAVVPCDVRQSWLISSFTTADLENPMFWHGQHGLCSSYPSNSSAN